MWRERKREHKLAHYRYTTTILSNETRVKKIHTIGMTARKLNANTNSFFFIRIYIYRYMFASFRRNNILERNVRIIEDQGETTCRTYEKVTQKLITYRSARFRDKWGPGGKNEKNRATSIILAFGYILEKYVALLKGKIINVINIFISITLLM